MHNCKENYDILMTLIHFIYFSIVPASIFLIFFNSQDSNRAKKKFLFIGSHGRLYLCEGTAIYAVSRTTEEKREYSFFNKILLLACFIILL